VKPLVPYGRFMACERNLKVWKECFVGKILRLRFLAHVSPASLLDDGRQKWPALANESGLIWNCAEAVGFPFTTQRHLKG
jgi:hypothetical protein